VKSSERGIVAAVTSAALDRPYLFLLGALLITGLSVQRASHLEVRSSFEELLPVDVPSVKQIKELAKRVGGDGTVLVVVEALDGPSGLKAAEKMADELAKDFLAMGPKEIRSVEASMAPVRDWFEDHWPLFAPLTDLIKARDSVREQVHQAKASANPLAVSLDDEEAPAAAPSNPLLDPKQKLPRELVADRFDRYVDGYMVAPDHKSITVVVRPTGTSLDVNQAKALVSRMQAVVDKRKVEIAQAHLRIGFGGTFPLFIADYEAIIHDVFGTAVLVTSLVLISIFLFFRDARSVLTLGLAVLIAVAITFGLTQLVIGYLNTQTAFLGAIVVGNGINYGLIYLARVKQLRWQGKSLREACLEGAQTTAHATLLASAATSISFGTLIIAANRGFRDFGFIGGIGMLLCWVSTFTLVPALLYAYEQLRGPPKPKADVTHARLERWLGVLFARPRLVIGIFSVLTIASALLFLRALPHAMERNLDNLSNEIKGHDQLKADHERANSGLGKSIAGSIALMDSWADADKFCDVIHERMKQKPYDELISSCDTLSSVVPRLQEEKLSVIQEIVKELPDNVIARAPAAQRERLRTVRDQLAAQRQVSPADVDKQAPSLLDRFRERNGAVGNLAVVTAAPNARTELAENLRNFVKGVRDVQVGGKSWDATGENVIFADLLDNIDREGPRTTFLSFAGVFLLVFVFFRNVRTSLEVVGTLTVGIILMCGAATALGLKINFFNFIVFPITFGIAVDYGANIAARIHDRGGEVLASLAEVGPAVALCSWTSIIGYGSLLQAANRALRSFGWYAMVGEVTTIATALILLPALLLLARRPQRP
jgi:predicted RND superfamily exporter protein